MCFTLQMEIQMPKLYCYQAQLNCGMQAAWVVALLANASAIEQPHRKITEWGGHVTKPSDKPFIRILVQAENRD